MRFVTLCLVLIICVSALHGQVNVVGETTLEWDDNSNNEDIFRIEYKPNGGNWSVLDSVPVNTTEYGPISFAPPSTYSFRILASNNAGNSDYTNQLQVTFQYASPNAPTGLAVNAVSASQINLSWSYNTDPPVTGFYIERKTGGGSFERIATVGLVSSYPNTGLAYGTTYTYRVIAYNGTGESSASSVAAATTSTPAPNAAYNLTTTVVSSSQINLAWSYNTDPPVTGFYIERKTGGGSFERIATLGLDSSYPNTGLVYSTSYTYRIIAYNGSGNSNYSNEAVATTLAPQKPGSVNIKKMRVVESTQLQLEWDEATNATGYHVYRATEAYFTPSQENRVATNIQDINPDSTGVQWIDTDNVTGDPDTNYFYVITALNQDVEGDLSNRVGEFDFELITTPKTDFNEITLPFNVSHLSDANDLLNNIPNCNSIAFWDATYQIYQQFIPAAPVTNFPISMGSPYYVNVTSNTIFTVMGELVECSYQLITTPKTDFNEVMLTLDKKNITMASELLNDIPNCNSVAYWHAGWQMYLQYIPQAPVTDFAVRRGYPYYVNVTADGTWPESGGSAKNLITSQTLQGSNASTQSPHTVWGQVEDVFGGNTGNIKVSAYIVSRPNEVISTSTSGCMVSDDYWTVQCSAFPSAWKAGEVLHVVIENSETGMIVEQDIALTYNPSDYVGTTALSSENTVVPKIFNLAQNYPNPFNPTTTIPYQVSKASYVQIAIFNIMGQEIAKLVDVYQPAGTYEVVWDGRNKDGLQVSTSMYLLRMKAGDFIKTKKMTLNQ